jgi:hypothetical protein
VARAGNLDQSTWPLLGKAAVVADISARLLMTQSGHTLKN